MVLRYNTVYTFICHKTYFNALTMQRLRLVLLFLTILSFVIKLQSY